MVVFPTCPHALSQGPYPPHGDVPQVATHQKLDRGRLVCSASGQLPLRTAARLQRGLPSVLDFWLCWLPGALLPPRPPLDTSPLASPGRLRRLALRYAEVTDLAPLASLTSLHSLDISKNKVHHLHPLAALTQLQSLDCNDIWTEDLTPITALTALTSLNCGRNIVEYRTTTADHNGVGSDF